MADKDYVLEFGSGNPQNFTGLAPSLISFYQLSDGQTIAPPGITELFAGSGQYRFQYDATLSIAFIADGGATLAPQNRYVSGILDPLDVIDQRIGSTASSFGSTSVDPGDLFGYAMRNQEWQEGDATFNKSSGAWNVSSRGSSTLLASKSLTNTSRS